VGKGKPAEERLDRVFWQKGGHYGSLPVSLFEGRGARIALVALLIVFFMAASRLAALAAGSPPSLSKPTPLYEKGSDQYLFHLGRVYFRDGHNRLAEESMKKLLKEHPGSILTGPALLILARIDARRSLSSNNPDFRPTLELFKRAGRVHPVGWDKGEVLFRMGQYLVRKRFGAEGRGLLERLRSESPDSPWSYRALLAIADSYRQKGDLARAEKRLLQADPDKSGSARLIDDRLRWLYEEGHVRLDRGNVAGAGEVFLRALTLSHDYPYSHPEDLFLLARYAYRAHHDLRAVTLFRRFARLFPNDPRLSLAMYYRARLSGRLGHPDRERARLRELTIDSPYSPGSHMARIRLVSMTFFEKAPPPGAWDSTLLSQALAVLARISERENNARIAQRADLLRISLLSRSGHPDQALRELVRITEGVDADSDFGRRLEVLKSQVTLARAMALTNPLRARALLEIYRVSKRELPSVTDPKGAPLYMALARAYRKSGEKNRAMVLISSVVSSASFDSGDPRLRSRAATWEFGWLVEDREPEKAMELALKMAADKKSDPNVREGWFDQAEKQARAAGNREGERRVLERWENSGVPVKRPDLLKARLGLLEIAAGDTDRGRSELLDSLPGLEVHPGAKPELAAVLYRLGELSREEGDQSRAREYWEKFLSCCAGDPHGGWVMYQLGQAALAKGRRQEALKWFRKTVKGYPGEEVAKLAGMRITEITLEGNP